MARVSTRTVSKKRLKQAIKYIENAAETYDLALEPYINRFPAKRNAFVSVLNSLSAIKVVMESSLADV